MNLKASPRIILLGSKDALYANHTRMSSDGSMSFHRLQGRAYQLEMLEESMKRNIIVAAETGSGKTLMYSCLF